MNHYFLFRAKMNASFWYNAVSVLPFGNIRWLCARKPDNHPSKTLYLFLLTVLFLTIYFFCSAGSKEIQKFARQHQTLTNLLIFGVIVFAFSLDRVLGLECEFRFHDYPALCLVLHYIESFTAVISPVCFLFSLVKVIVEGKCMDAKCE
jgi:hypothetical protein